jgi:putative transposase
MRNLEIGDSQLFQPSLLTPARPGGSIFAMSRIARIVIPGCAHHVVQRGNNRQDVFFVDDDRRLYLRLLIEESRNHGLEVLAYCLMSNHVHLIAVPAGEASLAKGFGRANFRYAQAVNRLHGRSGHLWQNRFYSCPLDGGHLLSAMQYVERNPVRAKLVRVAWRYPWSSAAAHCGNAIDATGLLDMGKWAQKSRGRNWLAALRRPQDAKELAGIRLATRRGRPLGGDSFMSKLERLVGRRLRPLPVGRPRKTKQEAKTRTKAKTGGRKRRKTG